MKITDLSLPEHHSLADWEFQVGSTRVLDFSTFYKAPASLKLTTIAPGSSVFLSLRENCQCVPEGRIEYAFRKANLDYSRPSITFHNQAPIGTPNFLNCYTIIHYHAGANLRKWIAGVDSFSNYWTFSTAINTWYRQRFSFWKSGLNMLFSMEVWDGGKWVQIGDVIIDPSPPWLNSPINRLGHFVFSIAGYVMWFDETFLYKRAPE